jgi:hypothetical protein
MRRSDASDCTSDGRVPVVGVLPIGRFSAARPVRDRRARPNISEWARTAGSGVFIVIVATALIADRILLNGLRFASHNPLRAAALSFVNAVVLCRARLLRLLLLLCCCRARCISIGSVRSLYLGAGQRLRSHAHARPHACLQPMHTQNTLPNGKHSTKHTRAMSRARRRHRAAVSSG